MAISAAFALPSSRAPASRPANRRCNFMGTPFSQGMARSLEKRRGETNESLLISLYAGFPMPRIVDRCTPFPCRLAGWEARYNRGSGAHVVAARLNTITGKPSPKVEIYHFCDALFARELLDYSLEFVVLMPCRIAVVEVSQQKIGLTMLDWDVRWTERVEQSPTAKVEGSVLLRRTTFFCNAYHQAQTKTACSSLPTAPKSITKRTRTYSSNASHRHVPGEFRRQRGQIAERCHRNRFRNPGGEVLAQASGRQVL
ncbi:DUF302 domain-containing protein [Accumulibacter sp.]|uniref:DUF302 domain-containing protein n=1 Tax=Accumulibacter sp. TaxID=2053492 RepID=UPI00339055E4